MDDVKQQQILFTTTGGKLLCDSVIRNFRITASDSETYQVDYFNLDAIVAEIEEG